MTAFALSGLLAGVSSIGFGLFVLVTTENKRLGRSWFLFTLSVAVYGFGCAWIGSSRDMVQSLWAWRTMYGLGVIWIPVLFFHFVCTFLEARRFRAILIQYVIGFCFFCTIGTPLFFDRVHWVFESFYFARGGSLFLVYFIWWMALVAYCHIELARARRNVSAEKRNQINYFLLATAIGFVGGSMSYLPSFGFNVYPEGNFTVCLYPLIMSIAIVRHQLMDVNLIIRKTVIYSTVTAALTAVYVLITIGIGRGLSGWVASPTAFSAAAAACVMALLFHPLRMKVQRFVDRHFFRETLDQAILREATSGFVHEIKRPLTNISLPAELSMMDLQDLTAGRRSSKEVVPKVLQRLQYILDQTSDAGDKIEAIRGFSESNVSYSDKVHLPEIIRKSLSAEQSLLDRHHIHLKLDIADDLPFIRGHEKQLEIVFSNLIKNAAEALGTMEGGADRSIWIIACKSAGGVELRIKDSGPGIRPENQSHLFEPYFTTKGAHGTGMGLFLCSQIVRAHGGTIDVQSVVGEGAMFRITFTRAI